jgi:hypothetical protein
MQQNKYAESDKKCCQWLDEVMKETWICSEQRQLLSKIKIMIKEYPEELESIRGKYLAFVRDENDKYRLYDYVFDSCTDATEFGLSGAFLFFVPSEHAFCSTAMSPYRNAIENPIVKTMPQFPSWCVIS